MHRVFIALFCAWRLAAQCTYTTLAGHAVTFAGDGVPVSQAVFHKPGGIAVGADGSLYIADTGNNRIRRIDRGGLIHTVAGTGQPSFTGDTGPATAAALNGPTGVAIGPDGTVYFSDTQNNRVRAVKPDGSIATVAGNGQWKFAGDGGSAASASLNRPGALAFDGSGNLLIADTGNGRVRRVDAKGIITTIAGSATPNDYSDVVPPVASTPALQYQLRYPSGLTTGPDGLIYITDQSAIWTLGPDGVLRPWLIFGSYGTKAVTGSILFSDLAVESANIVVLPDGSQVLGTIIGILRVASGHVTLLSDDDLNLALAADPSTGGVAMLSFGPYYLFPSLAPNDPPLVIARLGTDGSTTAVYNYAPQSDPTVTGPLNLALTPTGALAVGPDGTIYFGDATPGAKAPFGRILALKPDGSVRLVTGTQQAPKSLALDSKGTLYFVQGSSSQIQKVPAAGGTPQTAYSSMHGAPLALAIDGLDRLYFIGNNALDPLVRVDSDGTQHSLLGGSSFSLYGYDLQNAINSASPLPLAVSADGTLYSVISVQFSNSASQILMVSPSGNQGLLAMESRIYPAAMTAPTPSGTFIAQGPEVWKILPDGTIITVYGRDHKGFYGEFGFASEPGSANITGIALTPDGNLIVTDGNGDAIRRINTAACALTPGPVIGGIAESAVGNASLRRSAGQLFSIYGKRLGPAAGVAAAFDDSGSLPVQLAGVSVSVNGIAAPLLYVSATQINAIVPFALEGQGTGPVNVRFNGAASDDFSQTFGYYGPTVFNVLDAPTKEHFAVMQNQDGSLNSQSNPAKVGSTVTVYATGTGALTPAGADGKQAGLPLKHTAQPVSILINGEAAQVAYAGEAPFLVEGTTQINFQVPGDAPVGLAYFTINMGAGLLYFFYTGK